MSYEAKLTSKGQLTLPVELRERFNLREGDLVEFYIDETSRIVMRPRNLPASKLYRHFDGRALKAHYKSDDDAIAAAAMERDERSRSSLKRRRKSAA